MSCCTQSAQKTSDNKGVRLRDSDYNICRAECIGRQRVITSINKLLCIDFRCTEDRQNIPLCKYTPFWSQLTHALLLETYSNLSEVALMITVSEIGKGSGTSGGSSWHMVYHSIAT